MTSDGDQRAAPPANPEHVRRLLGRWGLSRLVGRLREHLERGGNPSGSVTLANPSDDERTALARLLGRPRALSARLRVRLPDVERVVRDSGAAPSLVTALEALGPPLRDRRAERDVLEESWRRAHEPLEAVAAESEALGEWLERVQTRGLLKRLTGSDPDEACGLAGRAAAVLRVLPADGVPRSVLAARHAGSGHALDDGGPLSSLVLGAVPWLGGVEPGSDASSRRAAWESVGVLVGGLEAPVLVLGLRATGRSPTAQALSPLADAGEPAWLTARQLESEPPAWDVADRMVFACENLSVVTEAATRLGASCAPLCCLGGHPSSAGVVLLGQLAAAGAHVLYHGDFDWGGVAIANGVLSRHGARPWRLAAAEYERALPRARRRLEGRPVAPAWDAALGDAMRAAGLAVEEELVLEELLADLGG